MVRLTSDVTAVQRVVLISLRIGTAPRFLWSGADPDDQYQPHPGLGHAAPAGRHFSDYRLFRYPDEPLFRSVQQKLDRLNTILQENIAGARLVKSFVRATSKPVVSNRPAKPSPSARYG